MARRFGGESLRLTFFARDPHTTQIACSCNDLETTQSTEPFTNCSRHLVLGFPGSLSRAMKLESCHFASFAMRSAPEFFCLFELNYHFVPDEKLWEGLRRLFFFFKSLAGGRFSHQSKCENHLKTPVMMQSQKRNCPRLIASLPVPTFMVLASCHSRSRTMMCM